MANVYIRSSAGTYRVVCERGAASRIRSLIGSVGDSSGVFIASSPYVWKNCGRRVLSSFRSRKKPAVLLFDDRESEKRLATVERIARALVGVGADRRAILVAVGGGVVGDVVGFVAATYLRGVRLVHVSTTLVAQVDSAIGGKTGVNLPEGKNLVGAFYPPRLVIADSKLLSTLPHREYRSGLYEAVKYGAIADATLFAYLEKRMASLLRRDPVALASVIPRCIGIKARIVERDEREGGLRQILNFGHTFGHALEAYTSYRKFLHGEAVGCGMIFAALLSVAAGRMTPERCARLVSLVLSIGPLPAIPAIPRGALRSLLSADKKARAGEVHWVLPREIGKAERDARVDWRVVERCVELLPSMMKELSGGAAR